MSKELKNRKSDYLLELALEEQLEYDEMMKKYDNIDETKDKHVFSNKHNKKMQKIFKMAERLEKKAFLKKKHRQLVAGLAILFCASAFSVTQVEAFRIPITRFFSEIKEKSTMFGAKKDEAITLTEKYKEYEPQYVPDGFAVVLVDETEKRLCIEYLNEEKHQKYKYYFFESTVDAAVDTEDGKMEEIQINKTLAYMVQKNNVIRILMDEDGKRFYLTGDIPYEEAVKIMESIKF